MKRKNMRRKRKPRLDAEESGWRRRGEEGKEETGRRRVDVKIVETRREWRRTGERKGEEESVEEVWRAQRRVEESG